MNAPSTVIVKKNVLLSREFRDILAILAWPHEGQVNVMCQGTCVASVYRKKHGASASLYPYVQAKSTGAGYDGLDALLEEWGGHKKNFNSGQQALRAIGETLVPEKAPA